MSLPPDDESIGARLNRLDDEALRNLLRPKPRAASPITEKTVLAAIVRVLNRAGYTTHRMTSGVFEAGGRTVRTGESGMPDLLVELPFGRCVWLEAKSPTGVVSAAQKHWHDCARVRGQHVAVVRSADEAINAVLAAKARGGP